MYQSIEYAKKLKIEQLVLCRCPNWCSTGYQVARWNGSEFYYEDDPNGSFHDHVIAFIPLNNEGEPKKIK